MGVLHNALQDYPKVIDHFFHSFKINTNCKGLAETLKTLLQEYEIIFVDDGSRDRSREVMTALAREDKRVKVIFFRCNYRSNAGDCIAVTRVIEVNLYCFSNHRKLY
jgi:cellulose synthase/poly-beta-1,6-N-acetylglucosamine synthase-like glycosyltransferase